MHKNVVDILPNFNSNKCSQPFHTQQIRHSPVRHQHHSCALSVNMSVETKIKHLSSHSPLRLRDPPKLMHKLHSFLTRPYLGWPRPQPAHGHMIGSAQPLTGHPYYEASYYTSQRWPFQNCIELAPKTAIWNRPVFLRNPLRGGGGSAE